ncbi:hypothetical protein HU720_08140 [Pseudomonas sp. SWRI51]|uniref:hypothetical protein n=1 Tax=Pseudomonas sp. SWRI51 TaxID=2745491 RepID=UPI0016444721|nr:hypothetical protein [Pseudomonas sp. SWRI51]MBC3411272.1 hypothetical protein [Pseudomonas sp. SWRI51]
MPWYRQGTVAIAAGQTTVAGTGTNFALNARVGDAFLGPDGRWYEVANIASSTVLSILPAYLGENVASGTYAITPVQGYVKESADRLRAVTDGLGEITQDVEAASKSAEAAEASAAAASDSADKASDDRAAAESAAEGAQASRIKASQHEEAAEQAAAEALSYRDSTGALADRAEESAEAARVSAEAAAQSEHNVSHKANSGANSDITSLSGLTTPLSLEQGGTGYKTGVPTMKGATQTTAGEKGLAPAPGPGEPNRVLLANGEWGPGGAGRFFGELVSLPGRMSQPNGVIYADGQAISNAAAQYPIAVSNLQSSTPSVPVVPAAAWLADKYARGAWAYDAATDTLYIPDLNGVRGDSAGPVFFRGDDGRLAQGWIAPGKIRQDQFQGHLFDLAGGTGTDGTLGHATLGTGPAGNGPMVTIAAAGNGATRLRTKATPSDNGLNGAPRTGNSTFPTHVAGVWGVVLFGEVSNPGAADAAALATSYANLSAGLTALESSFGFAYLYPNGGTEATPANVAVNSRYEMANPFPGHEVIVLAEIQIGGKWGDAGWFYSSPSGYGTRGSQLDLNTIVVQTGNARLGYNSNLIGDPFGQTNTTLTSAPCRVKVWRARA